MRLKRLNADSMIGTLKFTQTLDNVTARFPDAKLRIYLGPPSPTGHSQTSDEDLLLIGAVWDFDFPVPGTMGFPFWTLDRSQCLEKDMAEQFLPGQEFGIYVSLTEEQTSAAICLCKSTITREVQLTNDHWRVTGGCSGVKWTHLVLSRP